MTRQDADRLVAALTSAEDMRRDPGYATENVVPVTADEAEAMRAWVEAIRWATGHDLEVAA